MNYVTQIQTETGATGTSQEEVLYHDIRTALDRIEENAVDTLDQWVVVGDRLIKLREASPGFRGGAFGASCRMHGIELSAQQRSAAQWWARLSQDQRDQLHIEASEATTPDWLQRVCRERHPEWDRKRKIPTFGVPESKNLRESTPEPSAKAKRDHSLSKREREEIRQQAKAQLAQEELERARVAQKRKRETAAASIERGKRLNSDGKTVVMYGVQMWPVTEEERLRDGLGHYDFDQLYFAIEHFRATESHHLPTSDHISRATRLRERVKFLAMFVERRLVDESQMEMHKFIWVYQKLADLYCANPTAKCHVPTDHSLRQSWK